jgi:tripartite-type tricarboxylate transporter receptor subunit TctC
VGNTSHIAAEMFKSATGVDIGHVPYQGDAPAITALMSGVVDLVFTLPPGVLSAIQAGKLKPIATAAPQRSPVLPDLATFGEQGVQGVEAQTWFSLLAPAGTPADIVQKFNTALNTVLKKPEVAKRLNELGAVPAGGSVEDFKRFIATEKPKWTKIVKDSGATID